MAAYRLCQTKKAEKPYFIENISTNVFSMEELCFYISNNLYLLDETILNTELTRWLREELELAVLARRLEKQLEDHGSLAELILPIMKEIQYLSQKELKELQQELKRMEEQPALILEKQKGDYLVEYKKYGNALKVYGKVLKEAEGSTMGTQFCGSVYHNMGCAYARLFQMKEAISCFEKAYDLLHSKVTLRSYLIAVYLGESREAFLNRAEALGVDEGTINSIVAEILQSSVYEEQNVQEEQLDDVLSDLTEEYHRNTGY